MGTDQSLPWHPSLSLWLREHSAGVVLSNQVGQCLLTLPFWPPHCSFALTEALIYEAFLAVASRPLHAYLASRLDFIAPPEEDPRALQPLHSAHL